MACNSHTFTPLPMESGSSGRLAPFPSQKEIDENSFAFGPFPGTWAARFHGRPFEFGLPGPLPSDPPSASELSAIRTHTHTRSPVTGHGGKRQRFPFRYSLHGSKVLLFWYSRFYNTSIPPSNLYINIL